MNLSFVNITLFPMVFDHGSLTVHTSVCNMWSLYIDTLKAEANKGNKMKWVNPISARCSSIINHLVTNYLNGGDNVESHAWWPRKRKGKIHHCCHPNLFSLNLPSKAAVRRFSLLHHPLSKYQNLKYVGTTKVRWLVIFSQFLMVPSQMWKWKDASLQKWMERGSKAGLRGWLRLFPLGNEP